jgi:hypothetical protein
MSTEENNDLNLLKSCLQRLTADSSHQIPEPNTQHLEMLIDTILQSAIHEEWQAGPPEITGGHPNSFGMMIVRKRHQLVYSIKPSNFLRDPFISAGATTLSIFAAMYIPEVHASLPPTFPGFLIGLAFTAMRAFAHPVGYGEAALLHLMNQISEAKGIVPFDDLKLAGLELVERYRYAKGNNSNEIQHLITSLIAWKAIEENEHGYIVKETVPFGLGPLVYVD